MVCLYHKQHNRNLKKQLSSLMSGGAGPPHFQSPDLHLFLEPEPSRRWPALRCGLCHSDLSSFIATSWPLCPAGACSRPTPACTPPLHHHALASSSKSSWASGVDVGWCLQCFSKWDLGALLHSGDWRFRGRRWRLLSAQLIIDLTAPSKPDSLGPRVIGWSVWVTEPAPTDWSATVWPCWPLWSFSPTTSFTYIYKKLRSNFN